jgi:hypothetical protein
MKHLIQRTRELKLLLWAGVVVFTAGAVLDLVVHALLPASPFPLVPQHSSAENLAHVVTFGGMALLLAGVLTVPHPQPNRVPADEAWHEGRLSNTASD